jgi:hypothetical protein
MPPKNPVIPPPIPAPVLAAPPPNNPANGFINIKSETNCTFELYNMQGQLMKKRKLTGPATIISVDDLSAGNYIIRMINPFNTSSMKLIIDNLKN